MEVKMRLEPSGFAKAGIIAWLLSMTVSHSWWVTSAHAESATTLPIVDIGRMLGIEEVGSAYDAADGVQVCVRTGDGWLAWYPTIGRLQPSKRCEKGGLGPALILGVMFPQIGGAPSLSRASFHGADRIETSLNGGSSCNTLFPLHFVITTGDKHDSFTMLQRSSPRDFRPTKCDVPITWHGKQTVFNVIALDSFAISPNASIFIVYREAMPPKILQVHRLPDLWTDDHGFFIVSADLLLHATRGAADVQQEYERVQQFIDSH